MFISGLEHPDEAGESTALTVFVLRLGMVSGRIIEAIGKKVEARWRVVEKDVPRNIFLKWIGIGLLLRLVFMPISAAPDLLWFYWRAHLIVYHHEFSLGASQMLLHYIHAFFLWLLTPLMPYYETIWTHPWTPTHPTSPAEIEQMFSTFFTFVSRPHIFRTLFLLKFPFLLFDFGCLFFLNHRKLENGKFFPGLSYQTIKEKEAAEVKKQKRKF